MTEQAASPSMAPTSRCAVVGGCKPRGLLHDPMAMESLEGPYNMPIYPVHPGAGLFGHITYLCCAAPAPCRVHATSTCFPRPAAPKHSRRTRTSRSSTMSRVCWQWQTRGLTLTARNSTSCLRRHPIWTASTVYLGVCWQVRVTAHSSGHHVVCTPINGCEHNAVYENEVLMALASCSICSQRFASLAPSAVAVLTCCALPGCAVLCRVVRQVWMWCCSWRRWVVQAVRPLSPSPSLTVGCWQMTRRWMPSLTPTSSCSWHRRCDPEL